MRNLPYLSGLIALVSALLLGACSGGTPPTATASGVTPTSLPTYSVGTPSPSDTPEPIITSTQKPLLPSPTPRVHTVQTGDTLIGIAVRYDLTLEQLMAANPKVNPSQLSVGTEVLIPRDGDEPAAALPSPTPLPAGLSAPSCYPTGSKELHCLLQITNQGQTALENISVLVNLHDSSGDITASEIAVPPLDRLEVGHALPLLVRFSPPLPPVQAAFSRLLTSLPAGDDLPQVESSITKTQPDPQGRFIEVEGRIELPENLEGRDQVWVLITGQDESGQTVGFRKWISEEALQPSGVISFQTVVYSLAPPLAGVNVQAQLH